MTDSSLRVAEGTFILRLTEDRPRTRPTPTTRIDFEPEPVTVPTTTVGGRGAAAAEREVDALIDSWGRFMLAYWDNYHAGLNNFETDMSFASDQDTQARYFEVSLKAVAKALVEAALHHVLKDVVTKFPVIGAAVSAAKAAVGAWYDESERVAQAQGERRIAAYITDIRNQTGRSDGPQQRMLRTLDESRPRLLAEFRDAATRTGIGARQGEFGTLTGDAALFMTALRQTVNNFRAAIPPPARFTKELAERFAGPQVRGGTVSSGARVGGTLYLDMSLYVSGTKWSIRDVDSTWTLVSVAPKPDRLATALANALHQLNLKIWQTSLPKMVKMSIERERSGTNLYEEGYARFISNLDNFEIRSNYGPRDFDEAWRIAGIRNRALAVDRLEGESD